MKKKMRVAILDPTQHGTGISLLFPEAEYYSMDPSGFFKYQQRSNKEFKSVYGFNYKENLQDINDKNYDILIFIFITLDATLDTHTEYGPQFMKRIFEIIVETNKFKSVFLIDNHDYPYDPSKLFDVNLPVTAYFKRNYVTNIEYSEKVHPFPFLIFGQPTCSLWFMLTQRERLREMKKEKHGVFFAGALYTENNANTSVDRISIHTHCKDLIDTYNNLNYNDYISLMSKYTMSLDLNGLGNPNKRTFEILNTRSLMLRQKNNLVWPFDTNEQFSNKNVFKDGPELATLIISLQDLNLYKELIDNQNYIYDKYFTKEWLRSYIMRYV